MKTAFNGGSGGGGCSMEVEAFNGGVNGLRISDVEAKMAIDISGGGWRRRASAFDGGNGQRWSLVFDGGDGQLLWQQLSVDNRYGIQWWRWWWCSNQNDFALEMNCR